jgi:UDP-N-acetylmuramate: L-alanyl-gamma-D-glutamyl-meso-diaminopimelate ligase
MLAKILETSGLSPGFLIGGIPQDMGISARLGDSKYFVVEADEYDSAFFDKRSKFIHYFSNTLIINNLEFDHADIFEDLAAIQKQFHHLVRTVPGVGNIIMPSSDENINQVIAQGCWSCQHHFGIKPDDNWQYRLIEEDGSRFEIIFTDDQGVTKESGQVGWPHSGLHNVKNALAAVIAAYQVGVNVSQSCEALSKFIGVKRRMEVIYESQGVTIYDDFAHHPTAIKSTLEGLRAKVGDDFILAIIEPRSATMKMGIHQKTLASSVKSADQVFWYQNAAIDWDLASLSDSVEVPSMSTSKLDNLIEKAVNLAQSNVHIVIMSNGGFEGFHNKLSDAIKSI